MDVTDACTGTAVGTPATVAAHVRTTPTTSTIHARVEWASGARAATRAPTHAHERAPSNSRMLRGRGTAGERRPLPGMEGEEGQPAEVEAEGGDEELAGELESDCPEADAQLDWEEEEEVELEDEQQLGWEADEEEAEEAEPALQNLEPHKFDELDTTAAQMWLDGRDPQGIPWEGLRYSRAEYRRQRTASYRNYTNMLRDGFCDPRQLLQAMGPGVSRRPRRGGAYYGLVRNWRAVASSVEHFQLRNLVWATSAADVFLVHEGRVQHFSPATRAVTDVLDLRGPPRARCMPGVGRVQVSTLCAQRDLVAAGGFSGELVVARLGEEEPQVVHSGRVTRSENGITNGIEICDSPVLGRCLLAANNDSKVRLLDAATMQRTQLLPFPWAVNYATLRPPHAGGPAGGGGALVAVVGDDPATLLVDAVSGTRVASLHAHRDFSFAAAWHPGGHLLATGNQDATALVWDIRYPLQPLAGLPAVMGAVRSLRWSPDGRFLAAAEPADFVRVYDASGALGSGGGGGGFGSSGCGEGFASVQEIEVFGEISGFSFSPDAEALYVGITDITYSSLMQFRRLHSGASPPGGGGRSGQDWEGVGALSLAPVDGGLGSGAVGGALLPDWAPLSGALGARVPAAARRATTRPPSGVEGTFW